jgi:hypothetical protein
VSSECPSELPLGPPLLLTRWDGHSKESGGGMETTVWLWWGAGEGWVGGWERTIWGSLHRKIELKAKGGGKGRTSKG